MKEAFVGFVSSLNNSWSSFSNRFLVGPRAEEEECPQLVEAVAQAHREWESAKAFFESVTDPDLVDYAIFQVQATQKRYSFLLRQAREQGVRFEELQ